MECEDERYQAIEYVSGLYMEFSLAQLALLNCENKEQIEENIYDVLMDIVGEDEEIDHQKLLARIMYLEDGEKNGSTGVIQGDR